MGHLLPGNWFLPSLKYVCAHEKLTDFELLLQDFKHYPSKILLIDLTLLSWHCEPLDTKYFPGSPSGCPCSWSQLLHLSSLSLSNTLKTFPGAWYSSGYLTRVQYQPDQRLGSKMVGLQARPGMRKNGLWHLLHQLTCLLFTSSCLIKAPFWCQELNNEFRENNPIMSVACLANLHQSQFLAGQTGTRNTYVWSR